MIEQMQDYIIECTDRDFDDMISFDGKGSPTFNRPGSGYDYIRSMLKNELSVVRYRMIEIVRAEIRYQELMLKSL